MPHLKLIFLVARALLEKLILSVSHWTVGGRLQNYKNVRIPKELAKMDRIFPVLNEKMK